LVDAPAHLLDLDVRVDRERPGQPDTLPRGEQPGAGVEDPAGPVERVAGPAPPAGVVPSEVTWVWGRLGGLDCGSD
jgi:hypothetical protein